MIVSRTIERGASNKVRVPSFYEKISEILIAWKQRLLDILYFRVD